MQVIQGLGSQWLVAYPDIVIADLNPSLNFHWSRRSDITRDTNLLETKLQFTLIRDL